MLRMIFTVVFTLALATRLGAQTQEHHHAAHAAHAGHTMPATTNASDSQTIDAGDFRVTRVFKAPENFMGGLAYDSAGKRLWLLSVGPPANTKSSSTLYELNPETGKVLAQAKMPFLGDFGSPTFFNGHLYVGIPHSSKLHKVSVESGSEFGKVVSTVPLPTLNDLDETFSEPFRFPFINFPSLTPTPDKKLLMHAEDLGLFLLIDPDTGKLLKKSHTMKGIGGTAPVSGPNGEFLLLGNADPENTMLKRDMRVFMFRSAHGFTPPYAVQACGRNDIRDITWALLEPDSGEVISSILDRCSRTKANAVALLKQEPIAGFPYGRLTFLTVSDEGVLTVEWKPR